MAIIFLLVIVLLGLAAAFYLSVVFNDKLSRLVEVWQGVVIGKSHNVEDGEDTRYYITVKLAKGGHKKVQVRHSQWKFLHKGDKVVKHAGDYEPNKE